MKNKSNSTPTKEIKPTKTDCMNCGYFVPFTDKYFKCYGQGCPAYEKNLKETKEMRKARNKKGFTLIELMIVTAIVGILAAVIIPNYMAWKNKHKPDMAKAVQTNKFVSPSAVNPEVTEEDFGDKQVKILESKVDRYNTVKILRIIDREAGVVIYVDSSNEAMAIIKLTETRLDQ